MSGDRVDLVMGCMAPADRRVYALGYVDSALRRAAETGERPTLADVRRMLDTIDAVIGEEDNDER